MPGLIAAEGSFNRTKYSFRSRFSRVPWAIGMNRGFSAGGADELDWLGSLNRGQKCGAESSDPNRHSQPRLPGSVVGEASMRPTLKPDKITEVSVPK
jgi:hypothetical protein